LRIENKNAKTTTTSTTSTPFPYVQPAATVLTSSRRKNKFKREKHKELKGYVVGEYGINVVNVYWFLVGEIESDVLRTDDLSPTLGVTILEDSSEICYVNIKNENVDVLDGCV
jgi:hypothetical protein